MKFASIALIDSKKSALKHLHISELTRIEQESPDFSQLNRKNKYK